ncbi:MAG: molybdopterin cofactor-binding domain-containing protein [Myxococcota bacterium]
MTRPAETLVNLSRRRFVQGGSLLVGGLVLGVLAPRSLAGAASTAEGATATSDPELGSWLRIAPDGRVTVWVEKAEMGQGIHSSLAALVAEELDVPWDRLAVESRTFDGPLRPGITGASMSIRESFMPMRRAGAAARTMLIGAAAATWAVPAAECTAAQGRVRHERSGRSLGYGELAARAAAQPLPAELVFKSPKAFALIGKSLPRLDIPAKVSGAASFGIDVKVEGMLHAATGLAPVPGGEVESADYESARAQPGVRGIVAIPGGVAVVADHYWQARKALAKLAPVYSGGTPAVDTPAYSKLLHEALETPGLVAGETGDADAALAGSERVIEARYEVPWLAHATLEPMNCTASVRGDRCELWTSSQSPSGLRNDVGAALGIDPEHVTLHATLMGGAFGRRVETDTAVQAALASRSVGRPVKLVWSREDDMRHDFYRPACAARMKAVIDAAGRPSAFLLHVAGPWSDRTLPSWANGAIGAAQKRLGSPLAPEGYLPDFVWWRLPQVMRSGVDWIVSGNAPPLNYTVPRQRLEYSHVENALPVGWWRAVPASQNAFFVESFVDELAHAASADPYEFRRGLLGGRDREVLDRAAELASWGRPRSDGRALGIAQYAMVGTRVCEVAELSVGESGEPKVHRVYCAIDCGLVVNPDTVRAQVEGSILFGLTAALRGRITVRNGAVEQGNFHDYRLLRLAETPEIEISILDSREAPTGVGEPATPPIAPAVANALFAATRRRIRTLPLA